MNIGMITGIYLETYNKAAIDDVNQKVQLNVVAKSVTIHVLTQLEMKIDQEK